MQRIEWKKKDSRNVMETVERCGVPYLSFPDGKGSWSGGRKYGSDLSDPYR